MRLIDADALKDKLQQHHDFFVKAWGGFKEMPLSDKARCDELSNSIAEILNAPSIDIVRCGECKHGEYRKDFDDYLCDQLGLGLVNDADFFCSDGKRKDDEGHN